ncbi:MAG: Transcriptional regulator MntR [Phycisphaerae bacterium]|nr:Transcriptional regulator MntR [Phycisphaerae bacterium]
MRRLSPSQQDYLEVIWLLGDEGRQPVSASQIVRRLRVKPPTVTRMVQALARGGYLRHQPRGLVALTPTGQAQARMIRHIHQDLIQFLTELLGVSRRTAENDAAQIEHCLSPATARRLHHWLEMIEKMDPADRPVLGEAKLDRRIFDGLPETPGAGWRA